MKNTDTNFDFKALKIIGLLLFFNFACSTYDTNFSNKEFAEHHIFDSLLQDYVDSSGLVDYKCLQGDSLKLDRYLKILNDYPPPNSASQAFKLAFWINAYNAFTLKLIITHYPLKSINELQPQFYIPMVNSVWEKQLFEIDQRPISLSQIEHQILRKEFDEPRIHFAINCASISCPKLLNRAYTSQSLEQELQKQTVLFFNDSTKNQINNKVIRVSKILLWFRDDFTKNGTLIEFINNYKTPKIKMYKHPKMEYLDYDWRLNEVQ